jgi:hypothetical protein
MVRSRNTWGEEQEQGEEERGDNDGIEKMGACSSLEMEAEADGAVRTNARGCNMRITLNPLNASV